MSKLKPNYNFLTVHKYLITIFFPIVINLSPNAVHQKYSEYFWKLT